MTCREKLAIEHPEKINPAGIAGCPSTYGYLDDPIELCRLAHCDECWNRVIPETMPEIDFDYEAEDIPGEWPKENLNLSESIKQANEDFHKTMEVIKSLGKTGGKVVDIHEEHGGITAVIEPIIKDSGDRTQFESGAVRDMREGKGRCDLMPLAVVANLLNGRSLPAKEDGQVMHNVKTFLEKNDTYYLYLALEHFADKCYGRSIPTMFLEVAKHFEEGAKKYGENNWQKGIPVHCYIDSAVRHYLKWLRGDKDEPHDRAFVWNLMCCIWEVDYHTERTDQNA